ncbi:N-acetylglucosamine kinase [Spiractinospora alimapuensis]|uniref:N-acetylglucosamine kinase n=1 Tax=Spiractinospora alimapuensis TaxID=2820884 RepID=UPI001F28E0FC|nr:BadF/BadG/BcrA/BcrD ATPase family protein [Spiractinospora alimapuensis]QVQ53990.1 N-acetylglucosamine kinase [Spiractinospora alimapuensis]
MVPVGELVLGVDAGGTSTTCVVADEDGLVRGRGRGAGANPHSSLYPENALRDAIGGAIASVQADRIRRGVVGMAGVASAPHAADMVYGVWRGLGLPGLPTVRDDISVAFAAGTERRGGLVLISGTGAVAARIQDDTVVRRCDGNGWLLGDEGSAVWIALAGLRAVLAAWDDRGADTVLRRLLPLELGVDPHRPQDLRAAVYSRPPAELGLLAPTVGAAADAGDAVACRVTASAAERLVDNVTALRPGPEETVVLSGSVLNSGPVGSLVVRRLRRRLGRKPVFAGDGALGAAGIALRSHGAPAHSHAALLALPEVALG